MLNRKGQSLVLFVLLLPIMLGIMALVIDVGNVMIVKNNTNNVIEMIIDLSLERNLTKEEIEELLDYNLENGDYIVTVDDGKYMIESSTYVKGIFSKLFGFSDFEVVSEYVGTMQGDLKVIDKKK